MLTENTIRRHMHAVDFSVPCIGDADASSAPAVEDSIVCLSGRALPSTHRSTALPMRYISLWQEQPGPTLDKHAFRVYLTSASNAEFTIGIRTERCLRRKDVMLHAGKRRCIHLPNHGHRWRLKLTCATPGAWQPADGISVYLDVNWES